MPSPTVVYTDDNGYRYNETSPWWKELCEPLPCFKQVAWPDYATEVVEDVIDGKPIVIQLWKGWCQQFLGRDDFPGGIGAEVGIYERVEGRGFPTDKPDEYPQLMWDFLHGASKLAGDNFWWPVAEAYQLEMTFINPINNTVMFTAGPQDTYWLTKWMDTDTYDEYRRAQGRRWSWLPAWFPKNSMTPVLAHEYILEYKINGKTYPRW